MLFGFLERNGDTAVSIDAGWREINAEGGVEIGYDVGIIPPVSRFTNVCLHNLCCQRRCTGMSLESIDLHATVLV